jgi:hypothetical protein
VQLKSSARSALTEGSDSLTLVLIHLEVNSVIGAMQGVRRLRRVSVSETEQSIEGLLLQVCAELKELNTGGV